MKYESVTLSERNNEIIFLHKLQPELSLEEIGQRYHITKQRVSAILKRANKRKSQ